MDIYKALWSRIGGRPWSYILRDIYYKAEFVWIMGLVAIGVIIGRHFDWLAILKGMAVFTVGYIAGHLFWGKEYIPEQKEN